MSRTKLSSSVAKPDVNYNETNKFMQVKVEIYRKIRKKTSMFTIEFKNLKKKSNFLRLNFLIRGNAFVV